MRDAGVYQVGSAEHRNAAYQLALESMTLLKNEGNVLPLHAPTLGGSGARVVITGEGSLGLLLLAFLTWLNASTRYEKWSMKMG